MPDYFKPLRRKMGVLTLVMACVLTVGWVRSMYVDDFIDSRDFFETPVGVALASEHQSFSILASRTSTMEPDLTSAPAPNPLPTVVTSPDGSTTTVTQVFPIGISINLTTIVEAPYGLIVIPLILLSAWLLFSNRRVKAVSEQTPVLDRT